MKRTCEVKSGLSIGYEIFDPQKLFEACPHLFNVEPNGDRIEHYLASFSGFEDIDIPGMDVWVEAEPDDQLEFEYGLAWLRDYGPSKGKEVAL